MAIGADKKRLAVTISKELYDELMEKSDKLGVSASGLLVMYAVQHMEQQKMMDSLPNMLSQMQGMLVQSQKNTKAE